MPMATQLVEQHAHLTYTTQIRHYGKTTFQQATWATESITTIPSLHQALMASIPIQPTAHTAIHPLIQAKLSL